MEKNSVVLISFTGKELTHGRIYETTDEATAKTTDIWKEDAVFKPVPVIVGKGDVLKGMDDQLLKMKVGEEMTFELEAKDAFGERKSDLIRVIHMKEFIKQKITPFPGLVLEVNGMYGRVQTVSGGRVRVDFNNDLAGKKVEYILKVEKELKTGKEKGDALAEKFFPLKEGKPETAWDEKTKTLTVKIPEEIFERLQPLKDVFSRMIKENVQDIAKVEYAKIAEKKEKKAAEKPIEKNKKK